MVANARIEADPVNDLTGRQPALGGIGVELVEEGHPHRQVGVGEELDGLGLGGTDEEHRDIGVNGPGSHEVGEEVGFGGVRPDDDPRGVKVIEQSLTFSQELGGEDDVKPGALLANALDEAHRDC